MRYAVNIADLLRPDLAIPFQMMIAPAAASRERVIAEPGKLDGQALLLECPEPQAEAICRLAMKMGADRGFLVRCYSQNKKAWRRLKWTSA